MGGARYGQYTTWAVQDMDGKTRTVQDVGGARYGQQDTDCARYGRQDLNGARLTQCKTYTVQVAY